MKTSSVWFVTVQHNDNSDSRDIFVEVEDGTGIIDHHEVETSRNTNGGCVITISLFTAVAIDEKQFAALRKELSVYVNGVPSVILRQTPTDGS